MQKPLQYQDFAVKETRPNIGAWSVTSEHNLSCSYDLIEQVQYLYVRVVKARDLPAIDITGSCAPYVELKLGNCKAATRHFEKTSNPEWNQVFAFSMDGSQDSHLEAVVKDKDVLVDVFMGRVMFELKHVPKRTTSDSPLAPLWYRLNDRNGYKIRGELMLVVWKGTQADGAFSDAWLPDAVGVGPQGLNNIRSKVYLSPNLWYVRVNVIEAQDLLATDKTRYPEASVMVMCGLQALRTKIAQSRSDNPMWNEDLMFVAAEPFEEPLILTVEDRVGSEYQVLGRCVIPLQNVQRRLEYKPVSTLWLNLEKPLPVHGEQKKEMNFASRIHLRVCLEGGYHVHDTSIDYSGDLRPSAEQLWKPSIGILELGVINAVALIPMKTRDGRGTTDAYCVAKYGQEWVRTRTIVDSLNPKWNEQYTWEVFDRCTVITVAVFDNSFIHGGGSWGKDLRIGKVRIRISTLEANRIYAHSYPLLVLHPSGVKKVGEIQLAVRFKCPSLVNMLHMYSQYSHPLLPKMHYIHPLSRSQQDSLRYQVMQIVAMSFGRAEPPLTREVVEYMLDVDSFEWSLRRSKANLFRLLGVLSGVIALWKWFDQICNWKSPLTTIMIHVIFIISILYPKFILPAMFLSLFLICIWNLRWKPRHPPHKDVRLSHLGSIYPDQLDEEFDTFPTSRSADIVRRRYDRLRKISGKVQTVVGDLAAQGERIRSLRSWRDPRVTTLFVTFCLIAAIVLYVTPCKIVCLSTVIYVLRHPWFRHKLPSAPLNFFRRLPEVSDTML